MVYGVRTGDGIQPTTTSEELKNQERPGKKREKNEVGQGGHPRQHLAVASLTEKNTDDYIYVQVGRGETAASRPLPHLATPWADVHTV